MRDQRCAKCDGSGNPMARIKMISSRNLNEFVAAGKFMRQPMKKIEPTDHKTCDKAGDRNAQKNEQNPEITARLVRLREQIKTHADQRDRDHDQRDQANEAIEHHCQQRARFAISFFQQQITLNNIATGAAGQKLIVKHADQKQSCESRRTEIEFPGP